jgi:glutamate--cysteine ligase
MDAFLLYCLLRESPPCDRADQEEFAGNLEAVVERGRDPRLQLTRQGKPVLLSEWAGNLLDDIAHTTVLLDHAQGSEAHRTSLEKQREKVADADLTPSGKLLNAMRESGKPFYQFGMDVSLKHKRFLTSGTPDSEGQARLEAAAAASVTRQREIEAADSQDFDSFLAQWNAYRI